MTAKRAIADLSDPACDPALLVAILQTGDFVGRHKFVDPDLRRQFERDIRKVILRNPNLPAEQLAELLAAGEPDAWMNPAVEMHLLLNPQPPGSRIEAGLCAAALRLANRHYHVMDPNRAIRRFREKGGEIMAGRRGEFWDTWRPWLLRIAER